MLKLEIINEAVLKCNAGNILKLFNDTSLFLKHNCIDFSMAE